LGRFLPAAGGFGGLARDNGNFLPPLTAAKSMAYKADHRRPLSSSPLALHLCTLVRHQLGFRGGVQGARGRHRRASSPFPRCGSAPSRRRASLPRWDSGRCGSSSSVPALTRVCFRADLLSLPAGLLCLLWLLRAPQGEIDPQIPILLMDF
jgi:hypothetical protein